MAKFQVVDWLEGFSRSVSGTDGSSNRLRRTHLNQIRRHDFTCFSDAQLRETMTFLERKTDGDSGEDALPEVFAIVNEAIEREADLVLLGMPYKRRHGVFSMGEAIPYILRSAPCPVLVLREPIPARLLAAGPGQPTARRETGP